jgi:hypothetical protein
MPDMDFGDFLLSNLRRFSSGAARPSAWLRPGRPGWPPRSRGTQDGVSVRLQRAVFSLIPTTPALGCLAGFLCQLLNSIRSKPPVNRFFLTVRRSAVDNVDNYVHNAGQAFGGFWV